jgi:hypothetical protein
MYFDTIAWEISMPSFWSSPWIRGAPQRELSALYPMGLLGVDGPIKSQLDAQVGQGIGHICGLGLLGYKPPSSVTWSPRRV